MTVWIYSGGRPSNGAKELAKLPGFKRMRTANFIKAKDIIVNWGSHQIPHLKPPYAKKWLNGTEEVRGASNKKDAFKTFSEFHVQCVPWTVDHAVVDKWSAEGATIVGRQTLTGHSGHGIIIMEKGEPIQPALLYTKYIFKEKEYRVHVVAGNVVDTQRKIKDPNKEVHSWKVRSHENGFIFARNNIIHSDIRDSLATTACAALGLDFGAVDIIEDKHGEFYVLEVNTAPGLEGATIKSYGDAFSALAG